MAHDSHCHSTQIFHDIVVEKRIIVNNLYISCTSEISSNLTNISGWNDRVKPYKDASIFWHYV
ncbi:hypothetical protein LSH36_155g07023 [Paralvinella palmiformis]|uniref:Uncharacterized protein n=1 Tax=Paralvinella palmiformis TaxID=53620 RepID=A0AAD9N8U6_9ANNE|nr:hypothetical protein LSH36_155g07023 [Paralvinella palmiformis]